MLPTTEKKEKRKIQNDGWRGEGRSNKTMKRRKEKRGGVGGEKNTHLEKSLNVSCELPCIAAC